MPPEQPRRSIERKILTSMLYVGLVPLAVALVVGYGASRLERRSEVQKSLTDAVQRTAYGLRYGVGNIFDGAQYVASDETIVSVLQSYQGTWGYADIQKLSVRLHQLAQSEGGRWVLLSVHGPDGRHVASSDTPPPAKALHLPDVIGITRPRFHNVLFSEKHERFVMEIVAPVYARGSTAAVGYVTAYADVAPLLGLIHGGVLSGAAWGPSDIHYQLLYQSMADGDVFVVSDVRESPEDLLERQIADPRIVRRVTNGPGPDSGFVRLANYRVNGRPVAVYLSYQRLFEDRDFYVLAFRPAAAVYGGANRWALSTAAGCLLVIAFLFLKAYRNVHNNIARPVSLLNEGAQIIGQGDLELKLVINTGDEIQELATSFNKMAIALKNNIAELGESEERYRNLVNSMRDGIFQSGADWKISFLNPAGVELFGFDSVEQSLGKSLASLFSVKRDFEGINAELEERGFVERARVWMKHQNGRDICVELSVNRMHDDDGNIVGVEGIFRDVTKSLQLEQEARERLARITAINQIANAINSSLEAGRLYERLVEEVRKFVDIDFAALALLNEEGAAFEVRPLWPPELEGAESACSLDETESFAAKVAREQESVILPNLRVDAPQYAASFPENIMSCMGVPLYASGRIIGTLILGSNSVGVFSIHDIEVLEQMAPHIAVAIRNAKLLENLQHSLEEVTQAREKLHEANEELKTLDEMKTNLLSNVSHELRTPLVSVMGYTDMIYNEKVGAITPDQKEYLGISLRNIERLVTLIENLLDFSRLHRGTETLAFDTFDLVDCARGGLQLMRPVAESREITLELIAPEDPVFVEGDKGKLGQVFNNLLSNAVKFNRKGGRVTVEIRVSGNTVESIVRDTGIGIPEDALDKIFTRFYQYDSSSTRKYGGTGIGLSIAQDIARLHGSRITVSSEVGKGSVFRFSLPLRSIKEGEALPELPAPVETERLVELVTRDRALDAQVRNLLEPEGMLVIGAVSPAHAIALAKKHAPDCILLDMEASSNGRPVLDELLADGVTAKTPIIMLTNDEELFEKYRNAVAARVNRGFRKSTLLSCIRYAMSAEPHAGEPLGPKILCVDDDPEILTFMDRCLSQEGYDVDLCRSGEEALERVATGDYGLVLLDIAMPGVDGWEACRRIKENSALTGCKVYMVTAKPYETAKERERADADGYLMKPFRPEDLVDLVRSAQFHQPAGRG